MRGGLSKNLEMDGVSFADPVRCSVAPSPQRHSFGYVGCVK